MPTRARLALYYRLTKPGVLYGNVLTGVAGFFLATGNGDAFDWVLFVATILGMSLIIGAACALNNVFDRDIDKVMARTKQRAIASEQISVRSGTVYAITLGILGTAVLALWTNWLVVAIGIVGFVTYVWLYGALSKRRSMHGTIVGSISGAFPILAGYVAVTGVIDTAAVLVFLMLFFWQFPEFYAIAIYRLKEYKAAGVPLITVVKGVPVTIVHILAYTVLFVVSTLLLTPLGYTGSIYFMVMLVLGARFIYMAVQGLSAKDSDIWARELFHYSLLVLLVLCLMLSIGPLLP